MKLPEYDFYIKINVCPSLSLPFHHVKLEEGKKVLYISAPRRYEEYAAKKYIDDHKDKIEADFIELFASRKKKRMAEIKANHKAPQGSKLIKKGNPYVRIYYNPVEQGKK